jgi:multicomponent Na+:H+ antiporter subunit F
MNAVLTLLSLGFVMTLVRVARGPTLADRAIALDTLATLAIGMIAAYSIATNQSMLLDVAVVLALIAFLSTMAFAFYLKRWVK